MLNKFSWTTDDSDGYQGGESLSCQIGVTENGKFEIRNNSNPSESQQFESPEELGEALAGMLRDKALAVS